MKLFHLGTKKEEQKPVCACSVSKEEISEEGCCNHVSGSVSGIKVLGSGCKACHELYENTKKAVENAGLCVAVEYITDLEKVMEYGVMSMPGLVVNEKVVSAGKVLKAAEIEKLLHEQKY